VNEFKILCRDKIAMEAAGKPAKAKAAGGKPAPARRRRR
jgi:hypothetical protein